MRYYYKNGTSLFNMKTPHFIKYKTVLETDNEHLDENGQPITYETQVEDGLLDGYVQITEEEYKELTKRPEPTAEEKAAQEKAKKIAEYKKYLADTDYVVLKISEAMMKGDSEKVTSLQTEYADELAKRERARILINSLE